MLGVAEVLGAEVAVAPVVGAAEVAVADVLGEADGVDAAEVADVSVPEEESGVAVDVAGDSEPW